MASSPSPPSSNDRLWKTILGQIEPTVPHSTYVTWYKPTSLLYVGDDGSVEVSVANIFAKRQFEVKFNDQVVAALTSNGIAVTSVSYIIGEKKPRTPDDRTVAARPAASRSPRRSSLPSHGLNPRYVFDNYIVGSSNDLAYAACQAVAVHPGMKYNPLFIYGGVGLGKTHLMQAVGNDIQRRQPDLKVLYINCETFVNEFLDSIRYKKKGFSDKYRSVDVLIVDDMQFIAGKEKTQEEFFHTFNILHQSNKQLIISSDKPPRNIPTLTERLRSRFEWGMAIDIQMPDFETRCAIIETKAAQSGVELPRETTEYLARSIKTNIRELEGMLNQVLAAVELRGLSPDVETAADLLGSNRQTRPHHLTSKQLIDKVAKYYGIATSEIISARRDKHIVMPRQVAMYLLRSELHMSFPKIAQELGRKDHTTAIHSVEKIDKASRLDLLVREQIASIRDVLYG